MKTFALVVLLASVNAINHKVSPMHNQKLLQFATGMNGDEDLGQDIIMKGNKFHYNQLPVCNGTNGTPGTDCTPASLVATGSELTWMLPTCSETITTQCQPVCNENITTGCTEASSPLYPVRDRFEGKYTHKSTLEGFSERF